MGRSGAPVQEQLVEALARLLETPEQRAEREMVEDMRADQLAFARALAEPIPDMTVCKGIDALITPKRTRKAKAD